jgi:predicted dehydrogenase
VGRKDMDIYGKNGYISVYNQHDLEYRLDEGLPAKNEKITEFPTDAHEQFNYFAGVITGKWKVSPADLSSLENNLIVVSILDAAKKSSKTGKRVRVK